VIKVFRVIRVFKVFKVFRESRAIPERRVTKVIQVQGLQSVAQ
jgi:hypothetical protein